MGWTMPSNNKKLYAQKTTVHPSKTQGEIFKILSLHGSTGYGVMTTPDSDFAIQFIHDSMSYRFVIPIPKNKKGDEQYIRTSWRVLLLVIKAKLTAVETGMVSFAEEFFPQVLDPETKQTVYARHVNNVREKYNLPRLAFQNEKSDK